MEICAGHAYRRGSHGPIRFVLRVQNDYVYGSLSFDGGKTWRGEFVTARHVFEGAVSHEVHVGCQPRNWTAALARTTADDDRICQRCQSARVEKRDWQICRACGIRVELDVATDPHEIRRLSLELLKLVIGGGDIPYPPLP